MYNSWLPDKQERYLQWQLDENEPGSDAYNTKRSKPKRTLTCEEYCSMLDKLNFDPREDSFESSLEAFIKESQSILREPTKALHLFSHESCRYYLFSGHTLYFTEDPYVDNNVEPGEPEEPEEQIIGDIIEFDPPLSLNLILFKSSAEAPTAPPLSLQYALKLGALTYTSMGSFECRGSPFVVFMNALDKSLWFVFHYFPFDDMSESITEIDLQDHDFWYSASFDKPFDAIRLESDCVRWKSRWPPSVAAKESHGR